MVGILLQQIFLSGEGQKLVETMVFTGLPAMVQQLPTNA